MAIEKSVALEKFYTYDGISAPHQINLFNTSSGFYKRFSQCLKILPYRIKKGIFKTLNYKMMVYILMYILKKVFRNNKNLIIVYNGQPLLFGIIKRLLRPKKLIFICHGGSLKVYNKEQGEKEILEHTDTIVVLNQKVYEELKPKHPNVVLIPNYVNGFQSPKMLVKEPYKFLYVGRLVGNKRIKELCQIFESLFKDSLYQLYICGVGRGDYSNDTMEIIKNSSQVHYLGYLSKEKLKELYEQAKYIILISIQEGSPLSLIDSHPYNVIPIGNTVSGTQDFIEAFGGLLLPDDKLFDSLKNLFTCINNNMQLPYLVSGNQTKQQIFKKDYFELWYKSILQ